MGINRYKQLDVWLINFDPSHGAEIKKTRPAVIVSNNAMNETIDTVIVVPFTSTIKNWPFRVDTFFDKKKGQLMLDHIRSVDKKRLRKKIGTIDQQEADDLFQVLAIVFSVAA